MPLSKLSVVSKLLASPDSFETVSEDLTSLRLRDGKGETILRNRNEPGRGRGHGGKDSKQIPRVRRYRFSLIWYLPYEYHTGCDHRRQ